MSEQEKTMKEIEARAKKMLLKKGKSKRTIAKPTDDMSGHGWRKELVWKDLQNAGDKWFVDRYLFRAVDYRCGNCDGPDFTWLSPQRTGVYKVCIGCQTATGPLSMDDGTPIGKRQEITPEEAYQLYVIRGLERTTLVPKSLIKQLRRRRGKIPRRRKDLPKDIEEF